MKMLPRSTVYALLHDLGVKDPEAVFRVVIDAGHVTVTGYARDQFDTFTGEGPNPPTWTQTFPVDVEG